MHVLEHRSPFNVQIRNKASVVRQSLLIFKYKFYWQSIFTNLKIVYFASNFCLHQPLLRHPGGNRVIVAVLAAAPQVGLEVIQGSVELVLESAKHMRQYARLAHDARGDGASRNPAAAQRATATSRRIRRRVPRMAERADPADRDIPQRGRSITPRSAKRSMLC